MKTHLIMISSLLLSLNATTAHAQQQDLSVIRDTVSQFVQQQTASYSDDTHFTLGRIDSRLALESCRQPEAFLPAGGKLIGRTTIGVRCQQAGANWKIFVPVQIRLTQNLVISARQLSRDHIISAGDIQQQKMEVTRTTGFTDPKQVIGQVLRYNISQGQIINENMLRPAYVVKQGQPVQILIEGQGFAIKSEGTALNNASAGQTIRLRTARGKVISGVALENGSVSVKP